MTLQKEYEVLLKRKLALESEIEEIKKEINNNARDFDNLKFLEIDFHRKIKCRNNLKEIINANYQK